MKKTMSNRFLCMTNKDTQSPRAKQTLHGFFHDKINSLQQPLQEP